MRAELGLFFNGTKPKLLDQNLFQNYNDHMKENNHYGILLKMIINNFLNLRYHYICRTSNEILSIRNLYNKLVIFKGM